VRGRCRVDRCVRLVSAPADRPVGPRSARTGVRSRNYLSVAHDLTRARFLSAASPPRRRARLRPRRPPMGDRENHRLVPRHETPTHPLGTTRRHPRSLPRARDLHHHLPPRSTTLFGTLRDPHRGRPRSNPTPQIAQPGASSAPQRRGRTGFRRPQTKRGRSRGRTRCTIRPAAAGRRSGAARHQSIGPSRVRMRDPMGRATAWTESSSVPHSASSRNAMRASSIGFG
jgi:hypothetical protein